MSAAIKPVVSEEKVLAKAFMNAGKALGLSQADLGQIIGKDRSNFRNNIDPKTKSGELALLFIRCYRSLFALVGGQAKDMQHWMQTENLHTGGVPVAQVKSVTGLANVVEYLDAIRAKV